MTGALCLMTTDLPAIVRVAERAGATFAAIAKLNVPDPVVPVEAIVIHEGIPAAVHEHPVFVATEKVLLLAPAATETLAGVTVNEQVPA